MSKTMDEWRVGILFSRSGVSVVTESEHFRGTALAIEEINGRGGILGRQIAPVVYDPQSDAGVYRKLARKMLVEDGVNVIFGCSHSASRKAVLPVIERHNGLLVYPSMYEGFEYSENVLYTGATLNQNAFALADYLIAHHGKRIFLIGADYVFPRESNRVMRDILETKGATILGEHYVPLEATQDELARGLAELKRTRPDVVFSTIIGRPAQAFYRMYAAAGFDSRRNPIASLTMAETEIREIGARYCEGHILSATYLQTLDTPANAAFVSAFKARFGADETTSVWSAAAYMQVHLFAQALASAGSLETEALSRALLSEQFAAPEGPVSVDEETRHLWLVPRIGVARGDGLFDIRWQAAGPVRPDPYLASARYEEVWIEA